MFNWSYDIVSFLFFNAEFLSNNFMIIFQKCKLRQKICTEHFLFLQKQDWFKTGFKIAVKTCLEIVFMFENKGSYGYYIIESSNNKNRLCFNPDG